MSKEPAYWSWAAVALVLALGAAPSSPAAIQPDVNALIRTQTQQLLDAIATGDVAIWDRFLDDSIIHVDEAGVVHTKAQLLAEMRPLAAGLSGILKVAAFAAERHGDVVVATHEDDERLDYHGQVVKTRFRTTDTWVLIDGRGWRLVASHVTALLDDPPAIVLPREQRCAYAGTYALTDTITTTSICVEDGLRMERAGRPSTVYRPEAPDVFFAPGSPRSRRIFLRDSNGVVIAFVDRREGHDIRWNKVGQK